MMYAPCALWRTSLSRFPYQIILLAGFALLVLVPAASLGQSSKRDSECSSQGTNEIKIACDYVEAPLAAVKTGDPQIALSRAVLSFKTHHENYMQVELTFRNQSESQFKISRPVYLAIDDDAGRNLIRRKLTHVDFQSLVPGKPSTFSDRLLIGVLRPGHYIVQLWIPNPDPSFTFDAAHNLMLNSRGVANPVTGLNTLATFEVER